MGTQRKIKIVYRISSVISMFIENSTQSTQFFINDICIKVT